jgi:pimeloyl-ACP methyl ester carboxylesterase
MIAGKGPCVVFCPGFNSTMQGDKASDLRAFCVEQGLAFLRFDYSGHGESGGDFADGSISNWLDDTLSIIGQVTSEKVILVGSSMGGWIALLAALHSRDTVCGLLLIACAADMTKYYPKRIQGLPAQRDDKGRLFYLVANSFGDQQPYEIYQHLLDDGHAHMMLHQSIDLDIPVRLIHGMNDDVVEWQRSEKVMRCLTSQQVSLVTVKSGDHRLSQKSDLNLIRAMVLDLLTVHNA